MVEGLSEGVGVAAVEWGDTGCEVIPAAFEFADGAVYRGFGYGDVVLVGGGGGFFDDDAPFGDQGQGLVEAVD